MEIDAVRNIMILGAGTMGTGLAIIFAEAGFPVWLYSIPDPTLDRAPSVIRSSLETLADSGQLDRSRIPEIMGRIRLSTDMETVAKESDFFIEAVAEKTNVKKAVFEQLDALCAEDAIIASNTSYLNIFEIMPPRRLPNTAIAHFVAPAHIMPLVEVVRGEKTADSTVAFLLAVLKKAGRMPVVMNKYIPGFCLNRIQAAIGNEVYNLLDNGYISPEDLDIAMKASFIPRAMILGLVQRYDFTGLDLSLQNLKNGTYKTLPHNAAPECLTKRVEEGHTGVKSGKGFYDYSGRSLEEVLRDRDLALLKILNCAKEYMDKPV